MIWRGGKSFIRYTGNPLSIPNYEGEGVVHPAAIYFQDGFDGYKFWLYYTPFPPESAENPCLVRSKDGINFTDEGITNPLITSSTSGFDENYLADLDVIYLDGKFYMLYVGVTYHRLGTIGLAESNDGINFVKYEGNPILEPTQEWELGQSLLTPTVYYDVKKFHVLYEAAGPRKVGYAFGSSLYSLKKYEKNPVLETGPRSLCRRILFSSPLSTIFRLTASFKSTRPILETLLSRNLQKGAWDTEAVNHLKLISTGEEYYLYYVGRKNPWWLNPVCQLGLATSKNLRDWEKYAENPIMSPSTGWESQHIYRASPVIVNDKIYLYYSAFSGGIPHIGLAYSTVMSEQDIMIE